MSRAYQAERAFEREMQDLDERLASGAMTQEQYRAEASALRRDLQGAYEEDQEDASRAVDDEWGRW